MPAGPGTSQHLFDQEVPISSQGQLNLGHALHMVQFQRDAEEEEGVLTGISRRAKELVTV